MTDGIAISRVFNVPRDRVFAAWTEPERFARWFGGHDVEVPVESVTLDAHPGGAWSATMDVPGGQEIAWAGEYLEITAPERLVFTLSDGPDDREVVTVTLMAVEGGTEMTFQQNGGHLTAEQYEEARGGWEIFFDAMSEGVAA